MLRGVPLLMNVCVQIYKKGERMSCLHLTVFETKKKRVCDLGKYMGKPTEEDCNSCSEYEGPSRGLGDTVKNVISKATAGKVKPCAPCQKRREALNKMMGYKKKEGE